MITKYERTLQRLTTSDIVQLVNLFGIEETMIQHHSNHLIMPTACHNELLGEAKHKLYYYENSQKFYCYTCCGSMNPFEYVVQSYRNRGLKYSLENARIVIEKIIQERMKDGFAIVKPPSHNPTEIRKDWTVSLTEYNPAIMNCFSKNKKYLKIWEKEGISYDTMDKFGVKFDMLNNRIVMPIYTPTNTFVGAKVRNFNVTDIENGRKYMPLIHNKDIYTYDRGKVLYGLNMNKTNIKKAKRVIIFEAEKSVLMYDSLFVGNKTVAIGGSNVSVYQIKLLQDMEIDTIVLALDNDHSLLPDEDGKHDKYYGLYKMLKEANNLKAKGFNVEIVYDWKQKHLDNKDCPIDKGRSVWNILYRNRRKFNDLVEEHKTKGENVNADTKVEAKDF